MLKRILSVILLLFTPAVVWALYKPVRILAPNWVPGISCVTKTICLEDPTRYKEAESLYSKAQGYVESSLATFQKEPRIVFCSTAACFQAFGFTKQSATAVSKLGVIIGPRGWTEYYVRHEMIHHVQAERLGVYNQWRSPLWLKEGMAYYFSEDPRQSLSQPWQQNRARFKRWFDIVGKDRLWDESFSVISARNDK